MVTGRDGKQKLATSDAMSVTSAADRPYLMAIETFRKCNKDLLPSHLVGNSRRSSRYRASTALKTHSRVFLGLWDKLIKAVDPWKELLDPQNSLENYRTKAGGHVLVRPVGITAFVGAMSTAPRNLTNKHIKTVVDKFQDLNDAP